MKKIIYSLLGLTLLIGAAFTQESNAQSLQLDIRNQQYNGDTLFFDVYLSRNGGSADYYLGDADFVLNFNHGNFTSPTMGMVAGSPVLVNHGGTTTTAYNSNIAATVGTSSPNTNKLIINVQRPSFSGQSQFESNIARINTSASTHKLGTFWVKGVQDESASPSLTWVTAGAGIRTTAYTLNTSTPWKSSKIGTLTANNPAVGTQPASQVTALSVSSKTDTTISLSWTRGNGSSIIVLAKQGSAVGTDLPTDGIAYDADTFGVGSQIGSTGVYVVYRGTGSGATVLGLDPSTHYYFAALELSGSDGYNENYRTDSVQTVSDTTKAGEPATSASGLTITAFTTSSISLDWTSGSGANRIVVARAGSAVNVDPTDAFAYTSTGDISTGQDLGSGNIVVYDGSGSTATVTGLSPNTVYHFAVYEYNGTSGARNYKTTTPATNNRTTLETEPTTASSGGTNSGITTTSITFNWNKGNGGEQFVVVRQGSAVNADPVDGSAYTANAAFSSGDELGTGNYIVYRGTDTFITVTGLSANTTYYYEVFEVNGTGNANNFLTSPTLTGNGTTHELEPTIQASNLVIEDWSTTTLDLRVTKGNGAFRIIVAKSGSAVDANPVDGVTYSANAAFASGTQIGTGNYVVYAGTDSFVSVTGLTANTEYHFAVYEYNGGAGVENFMTTSPATADRFTLQTEPTTASTGGNGTGITTTSMTLSWSAGNGAQQIVVLRSGSAVNSDPEDGISYTANAAFGSGTEIGTGNYVVYQGTDTTVTITGLNPNTTYHYDIYELNGSGESYNYLTSTSLVGNETTHQTEPTIQASNLTIDAWTTSSLSLSVDKGDGAFRIIVARSGSAVNSNPVDGETYTANAAFTSGTEIGTGNYVVYAGTDSIVTVTGLTANTEYHFAVYEYNGGAGVENYLTSSPAVADRFTLQNQPTTASTDGVGSGITTTSMTISWDNGNGGEQFVVVRAGSSVNADPVDGETYTASTTFGSGDELGTGNFIVYRGTAGTVTITGLDPNTTYYYEIFEVNGAGEASNYLTTPTLTGDEITLQSAPTIQASNLTIDSVTINSMYLDWTNGNGAARLVVARAVSPISSPPVNGFTYTASATFGSGSTVSSGHYVVYKGTDSFTTVTGLSQDTVYEFAVYEYNGAAGSENFITSGAPTANANTAIRINITAILEGPFNGTDMDTILNEIDSIPLTQPYNTAPWNYAGTESIAAVPVDVVDWVYVQVRRASVAGDANIDSVVAEQAGFLMSNGLIMDSTGTTEMKLLPTEVGYGKFYVVVYHRNHVGVMSASVLTYNSDSAAFVFDFTSGAAQAHGTNALLLSGSKYVMYAGNADLNSTAINGDDRDEVWDERNAYGYRQADVNLDGNVTASDRSIVNDNTGEDEQIP